MVEVVAQMVVDVEVVVKHTEPCSTGAPRAAVRIELTAVASVEPF